ncbi:glycosyltransferase family 25 protein [Stemphylium lycopersici]|nr:glycosyltransferase family 25 protein [Stemphylium lycopersici]
MRRTSIDTWGTPPKKFAKFGTVKRMGVWKSAPRLFTTCVFFALLWLWFHFGPTELLIPADSFEYLKDESLRDILNTTLGFEKILVLNLPFRTDRRDAMSLSAAVSNIKIEFIEGVSGENINEKAYPAPESNRKLPAAFIVEDDVDWDIRVRQNLQRFALASRYLSSTREDQSSPPKTSFEQHINTETNDTAFKILDASTIPKTLSSIPLSTAIDYQKPPSTPTSPYGDPSQWDVLWLGHCGAGMPRSSPSKKSITSTILTLTSDSTVPSPNHLKAHPFQGSPDALASTYAPHTRLYHSATGGTLCTVGYAVSQRGARRLLHRFGVKGWSAIFDAELGRWCAGVDDHVARDEGSISGRKSGGGGGGGKERLCITTQPPIFAHHHPLGGQSDIGGLGGGFARRYETKYLRLSVRMNLERLVWGVGKGELVDQWPGEEGTREWGG